MNWKIIKEKYPKAHKYLFDHCKVAIDIDKSRFLYDFFDEQGIYIEIELCYLKDKTIWFEYDINSPFWDDSICAMNEPDYEEPYKTKTRTEAEEQAFLRAFKILEEKL